MKKLVPISLAVWALCFAQVSHSKAKISSTKGTYTQSLDTENAPAADVSNLKFLTTEEYEDAKVKMHKVSKERSVAESDRIDEESALSEDYKNLRNQIIGGPKYVDNKKTSENYQEVKEPSDLEKIVQFCDNDTNYYKLSADAKFLAAQIAMLKPYKSIIYRARPFVKSAKITHSVIVTALRFTAAGVNAFFPTPQWRAGFKFLTQPSEGMGRSLANDSDFYRFVWSEVEPAVRKFRVRIFDLTFMGADPSGAISRENKNKLRTENFWWDNKILYKTANFVEDNDRFLKIGAVERVGLLTAAELTLSALHSSLAYTWTGMFDVAESFSKTYGWDAIGLDFTRVIDGATAKKRVSMIKAHPKFLILRENGKSYMATAHSFLKSANEFSNIGWAQINDNQHDQNTFRNLIDARGFLPFNRIINNSMMTFDNVLGNKGVQSSLIAGEQVSMNFDAFFSDPPADMKQFLPTDFNKEKYVEVKGGIEFHNYYAEAPEAWDYRLYQKYFPTATDKQGVRNAARILNQTWGGWVLGFPVGAMLL